MPSQSPMFVPLMSHDLVREWIVYSRCLANTNDTLEPQNYDLSEVSILFLCPVYRKVMCYFSGIS